MVDKVNYTTLGSLQNEVSALATINANFEAFQNAINNTVSRDGTSPNSMAAQFDMNSHQIINLAAPTTDASAVTREYVDDLFATLDAADAVVTVHPTQLTADSTASVGYSRARYELGTHANAADRVLTFSSATNYVADYSATVFNTSDRRWTVTWTDSTGTKSAYVWPKQFFFICRQQNNWHYLYDPIWKPTSSKTFYVNHSTGAAVDAEATALGVNDGLTTSSAISTIQGAVWVIQKWVDCMQIGVEILVTSTAFTEQSVSITKRIRGTHVFSIRGNAGSGAKPIWRMGYGGVAVTNRDYSASVIDNFKYESSNVTATFAVDDTFTTSSAHGFTNGQLVTLTGAVPSGVVAKSTYYCMVQSPTVFKISTDNITPVNLVDTGSCTVWNTSGVAIASSQTGICDVNNCDFGYMPVGYHIKVENGGHAGTGAGNTISGDCYYHIYLLNGSNFISSYAWTLTGSPSWIYGVYAVDGSQYIGGGSWSGALASGQSYEVESGSSISLYGEVIPGSAGVITDAAFGKNYVYRTSSSGAGEGSTEKTIAYVNGSSASNNDVVLTPYCNFYIISGPTAGFDVTGFSGGVTGRTITLVNNTGFAMTIKNSAGSAAANQILTGTGADVLSTTNNVITLTYSVIIGKWILTSHIV